jgi:hypothetical protein
MPGMKATMDEFKARTLRSGSKTGPKVKSRKQAIAIGLNEAREAGDAVPAPGNSRRAERYYAKSKKA